MLDMPGDFAVVIHGEFDCVNCFTHHSGRSAHRYYSTRLTDGQLTTGETAEPLRRCLELIAQEEKPEAVIVLGTCPVEVIGDQFHHVVDEVAGRTGVPMVALHTSGLRLSSQAEMLDWCFDTLASLGGEVRSEADGGVNLLGMPPIERGEHELEQALAAVGRTMRASFPDQASMTDWRTMGRASHTFLSDPAMFPKLQERLRGVGQQVIAAPLPFGRASTLDLYRAVDQALDLDGALLAAVSEADAAAEDAIAEFAARHGGKGIAIAIRMRNTYRSDVVARGGLGQLPAFAELGLQPTLLVQGAPDPDVVEVYRAWLDDRGVEAPMKIFGGPYELEQTLRSGDFHLCSVADHGMHQVRAAGIPAIDTVALQPYLSAVPDNVARISSAMEGT